MRRTLTFLAPLFVAATASAQLPTTTPSPTTPAVNLALTTPAPQPAFARTVAGPSIAVASVAFAPATTTAPLPAPQRMTRTQSRGMTFMIVGAAALIGGLVIGDDAGTLIAIGGLGVGLYGLYLYVQ